MGKQEVMCPLQPSVVVQLKIILLPLALTICPGLSWLGDSFAFPQALGKPSMLVGLARGILTLPQFQSNLPESKGDHLLEQRGLGQR